MDRNRLTTLMALLVGFIWAVVTLTSLLTQQYTPLSIVTPVMVIVAGFLFGYRGPGGNNK